MSTRAVYTFKDVYGEYHVYKHHDGYPTGAAEWISNAVPLAWKLPRFEACEFSAAFVAGNKDESGGSVYLTHHYNDHGDLDYRYEITEKDGVIIVTAYYMHPDKEIFKGTLADFVKNAKAIENGRYIHTF